MVLLRERRLSKSPSALGFLLLTPVFHGRHTQFWRPDKAWLACVSGQSPSEAPVPKRVGLTHISQVISEVDGNRVTLSQDKAQDSLPLQQKILVCSLLLLTRRLKLKEVTLGKVSWALSRRS